MPYFSIILPTYNRSNLLSGAIKSVINQSLTDWELLIIDDGSTDNTKEVVLSFNDSRIRYIYQDNAERSAARNRGIKESVGIWVCFLDSDDIFFNNYLKNLKDIIDYNNKPSIIVSGYSNVDAQFRILENIPPFEGTLVELVKDNVTIPSQVICCHKSYLMTNRFNEALNLWEDTHLWFRVLQKAPLLINYNYDIGIVSHSDSGLVKSRKIVDIRHVEKYEIAVNDLFEKNAELFKIISKDLKKDYLFNKLHSWMYVAKYNGQISIAIKIYLKSLKYASINKLPILVKNYLGLISYNFINYLKK